MSAGQKPRRSLAPLPDGLPAPVSALAEEMRLGREIVDLSLSGLARQVLSSKASVSRWLSGAAVPTREQACRWAQVCGTSAARMGELWDAVEVLQDPSVQHAQRGVQPRSAGMLRWFREHRWWVSGAVALLAVVVSGAVYTYRIGRCPSHRVALQVPSISGRSMGVAMRPACALAEDRTYLLIEEVPDVDPGNPHSVYFAKAYLIRPERGVTSSHQLLLEEPVGTRAAFYVISVDDSGRHALEQNKVVDEGVLELPRGTRVESEVIWHVKKWQGS
ncbi:helix-turn-helix domain-containing protein [Actinoplanes sp. G11-F43]|uniref:helix-turn-helix domain-containing protein n=1 Tax=Actinoplanes sp. G11-F43 TaxID=3424130 RepID=UPI003D3525A5